MYPPRPPRTTPSIADLVADINAALAAYGLADRVIAGLRRGGRSTWCAEDRSPPWPPGSSRSRWSATSGCTWILRYRRPARQRRRRDLLRKRTPGLNRILGGPMGMTIFTAAPGSTSFTAGTGTTPSGGRTAPPSIPSTAGSPVMPGKNMPKRIRQGLVLPGDQRRRCDLGRFRHRAGRALAGQHLITRLTNNNGNYTFDAAVKLSLNATNAAGELIWNTNDSLPADDDYLVIIIDCHERRRQW